MLKAAEVNKSPLKDVRNVSRELFALLLYVKDKESFKLAQILSHESLAHNLSIYSGKKARWAEHGESNPVFDIT